MRLLSKLIIGSFLMFSLLVQADVYRHVDAKGRVYFSDSPQADYRSKGYSAARVQKLDYKALEETAKRLKQDRLLRDSKRQKALAKSAKKRKQQQKLLAAAEKRKKACYIARKKEDLAFRNRTKRQSLTKMRNALSNYEKKREMRIAKCS